MVSFGNVLVPATVLFSGGEFINLALCVRILDNHLSFLLIYFFEIDYDNMITEILELYRNVFHGDTPSVGDTTDSR